MKERPWQALRADSEAHPFVSAAFAGALALVYFGSGLGAREVSLLESQDLANAAEFFRTFQSTAEHCPVHFALLNIWLRLGGVSVALLRLPSALCVAAATTLVFRLGARIHGLTAAAWSVLLFATNPEIVSQARSLRLFGFGILLAVVCLERAHALFLRRRPERAFYGFLASAVIAVHTHLCLWLWVLPLTILVAWRARSALVGSHRRPATIAAVLAVALMAPQLVYGFEALRLAHERWLAGMSDHLDLCFALPGLAVIAGIGLARLPLMLAATAAAALVTVSSLEVARAYGPPAPDWYSATEELERIKQPDDIVAVFPGYWRETFRFYTRIRELSSVSCPEDLVRVLAHGHRVILVVNAGAPRADIEPYLAAATTRRVRFRTRVRDQLEIDEVYWSASLTGGPEQAAPTLLRSPDEDVTALTVARRSIPRAPRCPLHRPDDSRAVASGICRADLTTRR